MRNRQTIIIKELQGKLRKEVKKYKELSEVAGDLVREKDIYKSAVSKPVFNEIVMEPNWNGFFSVVFDIFAFIMMMISMPVAWYSKDWIWFGLSLLVFVWIAIKRGK